MMLSIPDLASAIGSSVFVLLMMSVGSGIGEEIAGFLYGKTKKGGLFQIIYMLVHLPVFIIGGYVYTLLGIPAASVISSALFFGLWGVFTVFVSRGFMAVLARFMDFRLPKSMNIDWKNLLGYLKESGMEEGTVRVVLVHSCDSDKKVDKILNGKDEKAAVEPEALCYALSKQGMTAGDIIHILVRYLAFSPEEAGLVWRRSSL